MLEQLFGSKTRTKLMKLFLTNPTQPYFIRELTRVIDTQINSVRRELKNLEECGLVVVISEEEFLAQKKNSHGNTLTHDVVTGEAYEEEEKGAKGDKQLKKYYKANTDFALYNEMKALFQKSPLMIERDLLNELNNLGTVYYVALCGFFTGQDDAATDLVMIGTINKQKLEKILKKFNEELEREINYTIMTLEEYHVRKSVTDRFLFHIMEAKKKVLYDTLASQKE